MAMIDLSTADLRAGAREAGAVADAVGVARQASGAALPGDAFGILCSGLFLPAYQLVQTAADALMDSAMGALERSAANLRDVADSFDDQDATAQASFDTLSTTL